MSIIKLISNYPLLYNMYEYLELLLHTAKKEGLFGSLKSSTLKLAKELNIPQQTISRKLREMEANGLIKRSASPNGLTISLDQKGREFLQKQYHELSQIFKTKKTSITGSVEKGIGEGAYYVSQKGYQEQFRAKLGFEAFPGTLNLKVKKEELAQFLAGKESVKINGFETKTRTFGSIASYKIRVNNTEAAIVKPERARHPEDIIEIIAPINLRDSLKLKDNSKVKIS